jgi:putative acetyltransferase
MLQIGPETPADEQAIEALLRAAFAHHPHSNQTEHLLVDTLRAAGALSLSLVARDDAGLAGYAGFSPVTVDGADCGCHAMAPLAVSPDRQGHGIGRQLVEAGLASLASRGARACVVVGDPVWYRQSGFVPAHGLLLEGIPKEFLLVRSLDQTLPTGRLGFHPAFAICA